MEIRHLYKSYAAPVLVDFSYAFPEKGLVVIRGKSGCGKTTLLRLISGLEKPDQGKIDLQGKRLSVVFQEARLVPFLTLKENLFLVSDKRDEKRAEDLLIKLDLAGEGNKFPHQLSGGMRLRGAIARSLYFGGDIYLWDEPTKELDPENQNRIKAILRDIAKEKLVIVVTHDPTFVGDEEILFP